MRTDTAADPKSWAVEQRDIAVGQFIAQMIGALAHAPSAVGSIQTTNGFVRVEVRYFQPESIAPEGFFE